MYVLGGNHSFIARSRLAVQYPSSDCLKWIEANVLAGLTASEMRLLATDHNFTAECRKTFTFADKVRYIRFEKEKRESEEQDTGLDWKLDIYSRLGMLASVKKGDEVKRQRLVDNNTLEYCVAQVSDGVWQYVDEIFDKFESKRLLEQIAAAAALEARLAKSKRRPRKANSAPDAVLVETKDKGIPVRVWRGFQGIDHSAAGDLSLKTACLKVLSGELTLKEMHGYLEKCKKLHLIHTALIKHLNCETWEDVQERYPNHSTTQQMSNFQLQFNGVVSSTLGFSILEGDVVVS